ACLAAGAHSDFFRKLPCPRRRRPRPHLCHRSAVWFPLQNLSDRESPHRRPPVAPTGLSLLSKPCQLLLRPVDVPSEPTEALLRLPTDTRNHAGGFLPHNKRQRYFVASLAQINIYEIDARSSDFDYSFTGFRLRDRKINKLQGFRPARLLHVNGFHGLSRFRR